MTQYNKKIYEVEWKPSDKEYQDKIRGISTDYWEQLTLAESQNETIRKITYKRLEKNATERGFQYLAELAYAYRQKCNNTKDRKMRREYCDEYLSFMDRTKEKCSKEEYGYIEVYCKPI